MDIKTASYHASSRRSRTRDLRWSAGIVPAIRDQGEKKSIMGKDASETEVDVPY
jgi:hypothetical protein